MLSHTLHKLQINNKHRRKRVEEPTYLLPNQDLVNTRHKIQTITTMAPIWLKNKYIKKLFQAHKIQAN